MRYKEFKTYIEDWGKKHDYNLAVKDRFDYHFIEMVFGDGGYTDTVCAIHKSERFVIDLRWATYRNLSENEKKDLFEIVTEFAATKPEEREDEKRFIIPLYGLVTTDGKQQYLTYKDCRFFASRRDETLMQTWEEEHLELIPEQYRQFAVEFEKGNKNGLG